MVKNFGMVIPSEWIGLTLGEAREKAIRDGLISRIGEIDGRAQMLTEDLASNRINFRVRDNKVVDVYTG